MGFHFDLADLIGTIVGIAILVGIFVLIKKLIGRGKPRP